MVLNLMETQSTLKTLSIPISIVIAGAFIAGALFFGAKGIPAPVAGGTQQPTPQAPAPQVAVDISKVKTAGEPTVGNPNAPVAMAYWYDYQCPFCKRNEEEVMPQIVKDYVLTGKVKIVFKDFQFLSEDSQRLGKVSRAVWDTDPSKFYQWHKAVYDNQGTENTGWATDAKILSITTGVLGAADAQKVMQLAVKNADAYQKMMDADKAEGGAMGVNGTPGTIIGKQLISGAQPYEAFKVAIDAVLKSK
jgi:protein-disulfide isomerase